MLTTKLKAATAATTAFLAFAAAPAVADFDLEFYFPVAVGGAAANTIEELTADYVAANEGVNIEAIYAGSYQDTVAKALTAARGGNAPQLSVILSVDMYTLYDEDLIHAFDDFAQT
ncbi:MAG: extracellular solute-binding protein, partial [Pseudomonadota bacterium]